MTNPANVVILSGRLANDVKVFPNQDGSKKVLFTLYVDRNYTNRQGERLSDAIPVEAFISASTNGIGPYMNIHKGDQVSVAGVLRMDTYTDKTGTKRYDLKVISENLTFLESRGVTQDRLAKRAQAAQTELPVAQQAAPQSAPAAGPATQHQMAPTQTQAPAPAPQYQYNQAQVAATPASDQAQFAQVMGGQQAAPQGQYVAADANLPF